MAVMGKPIHFNMKKILIILFICFNAIVRANTYYVATTGDNGNAGTLASPWATWQYAMTTTNVNPGDTVFIRGGVYPTTVTNGAGICPTRDGTTDNWIVYINYPGETPILDGSNSDPLSPVGYKNVGIRGDSSNPIYYVKFQGLTVRNFKQYTAETGSQGVGWFFNYGIVAVENCVAYNCEGAGFYSSFSGSNDGQHVFTNCDAYNICDSLTTGNAGTGFDVVNRTSTTGETYFYNCRAWHCSDQGFNVSSCGYIKCVGCWSFCNTNIFMPDGSGYKLGWIEQPSDELRREVYNCFALYNDGSGFFTNEWYGNYILISQYYNNISYANKGSGFNISRLSTGYDADEYLRIFRNNVSYGNVSGSVFTRSGAVYTHDHNSWDISGLTVNNLDFQSIDSTGLTAPRQADGSLPDNDCYNKFLRLSSTSQLRGIGVDVGLTYDADSILWGTPPSIGAYEYNDPDPGEEIEPLVIFTTGAYPSKTTCSVGGNVYDDGGGTISARGVVWSTGANPDLTDNVVTVSGTTGAYVANITGLTEGSTFHVRAYATNEVGTQYGEDLEFTTKTTSFVKNGIKWVFYNGKWVRI